MTKLFFAGTHPSNIVGHNFHLENTAVISDPEQLRGIDTDKVLVIFCNHCLHHEFRFRELLDFCSYASIKYIILR